MYTRNERIILTSSDQLNENTLNIVAEIYGITVEQALIFWGKSASFNKILMKKYGDKYVDNWDEVSTATKAYQSKLLSSFKN